eukprot:9489748-Pyramimonas_sp.AAC.1
MLVLLGELRPRLVPRHQPGDAGGVVRVLVHLRVLAAGPVPGPRARGGGNLQQSTLSCDSRRMLELDRGVDVHVPA